MKLKIKKLKETALVPSRATSGSAGFDLCACLDSPVTIKSGEIRLIQTGISCEPDCSDAALLIYPRSGLSSKYGISLANCVGVVDSDYRGEICVPLINHGCGDFTVEHGMRIAQLVIAPVIIPEIELADSISSTERGCGGFGSTGI